jgi:hypothetical protein
MRIVNQTRNAILVNQGCVSATFWSRLRGLLGRSHLERGDGLVLVGEKSIHTFFMKFPLDVLYVDKNYQVIRADINMIPYRLGPFIGRCAYVVEMPVGMIAATATEVGDQLRFET